MSTLISISPPGKQQKQETRMTAFLSLGFRPLYIAGTAWALISILLWIYTPQVLQGTLNGVWWHAHEMLWAFVGTIAVGFLTTASATWTGSNPIKGIPLALLAFSWLVARIAFLIPGESMFFTGMLYEVSFCLVAAFSLFRVILKAKSKRNYALPWAVLALGLMDLVFLITVYQGRYDVLMSYFEIGILFMVLITLLIARRVVPFFATRKIQGLEIPMHTRSGLYQLIACGAAIFFGVLSMPEMMAIFVGIAGVIAIVQVIQWKPAKVMKVSLLWVLYLAYFFLGLGLVLSAFYFAGIRPSIMVRPASYIHVIGMGGFSIMIIGMVTRTALGHTGHPLQASRLMTASYVLVLVATIARLAALQPSSLTQPLLHLAGAAWILAFAFYLWEFVPILTRPRADQAFSKGGLLKPMEKK
ncbi:MAG: NnrS family protein [Alcaligenaceae bacterium]|nr:NnrS family protein [Alcaligenaceae bacterium]